MSGLLGTIVIPRAVIILVVVVVALIIAMVALSKRSGERPLTRIEQPVVIDGTPR